MVGSLRGARSEESGKGVGSEGDAGVCKGWMISWTLHWLFWCSRRNSGVVFYGWEELDGWQAETNP